MRPPSGDPLSFSLEWVFRNTLAIHNGYSGTHFKMSILEYLFQNKKIQNTFLEWVF